MGVCAYCAAPDESINTVNASIGSEVNALPSKQQRVGVDNNRRLWRERHTHIK